jgi:hypothetical protein
MKRVFLKTGLALFLIKLLVPSQALAQQTIPLVSPLGPSGAPTTFDGGQPGALSTYINNFYLYAIGLGALLAMAVIIFGAIKYMTERGNSFKASEAKNWIFGGIIGLILLVSATLILTTLNKGISDISLLDRTVQGTEERGAAARAESDAEIEARLEAARNRQKDIHYALVKQLVERARATSDFYRGDPNSNAHNSAAILFQEQLVSEFLNSEYNLKNNGDIEGYWEALQEVFAEYEAAGTSRGIPTMKEEYLAQKAEWHHSQRALKGLPPTSPLDNYLHATDTYPPEDTAFLAQHHFNKRRTGTNSEMNDVSNSREKMWEALENISKRGDMIVDTFPGHEGAREGVYAAFLDQTAKNYGDPNVTPKDFLRYMEEEGYTEENNWLVARIKAEIAAGLDPDR